MFTILHFIILLNNKNYLSIIIILSLLFNYNIYKLIYIFDLNSISNYKIIDLFYKIIILLIIT